MRVTNPHGLPEAYVTAVSQFREHRDGEISVTELLSPPQMRALQLRHWDEIELVADERLALFLGNAAHRELAFWAPESVLAEERMAYVVGDWKIAGTPDYFDVLGVEAGTLIDWKTTMVDALLYERPEWTAQTNLYAHLLDLNGYPVERLVIKPVLRDWRHTKLMEDGYPRSPICHIDVPLWDAMTAHGFLRERLTLHKRAARGYYEPCTPEEQWRRSTWAVVKEGNGRATKVLPSRELADEYVGDKGPEYAVVERPGEPLRCQSYCMVAAWCYQAREEREARESPLEHDLARSLAALTGA